MRLPRTTQLVKKLCGQEGMKYCDESRIKDFQDIEVFTRWPLPRPLLLLFWLMFVAEAFVMFVDWLKLAEISRPTFPSPPPRPSHRTATALECVPRCKTSSHSLHIPSRDRISHVEIATWGKRPTCKEAQALGLAPGAPFRCPRDRCSTGPWSTGPGAPVPCCSGDRHARGMLLEWRE